MDRAAHKRWMVAAAVAGLVLAAGVLPAVGVIRVDFPVSKIYDASKAVAIGTVGAVNPDNRVLEVKITETVKGDSPGETVRVQIMAPAELIKDVAAGKPLILFVAKDKDGGVGLIHLADTWLMAERIPNSTPQAWRIGQVYDAAQSFPGRTAALVRLMAEFNAGKPTLLDKIDPVFFRGGAKEVAKLAVAKPTFLVAADVNGDKKPDLVVGAVAGVRLFLATGAGYEDATEKCGLAGAAGAFCAAGDFSGDGKVDLLIGKTLWINEGGKFVAAKAALDIPDGPAPLAAALADVTGDKKPDALILLPGGKLLVFENSGAADKPWTARPARTLWQDGSPAVAAAFGNWDDNGKVSLVVVRDAGLACYAVAEDGVPPAEYPRLTGNRQGVPYKAAPGGPKNAMAVAMDVSGDRRVDFLLLADGADLLLINRGFGTFLPALDIGAGITPPQPKGLPFKPTPSTPWAAADLRGDGADDLLVLTEDGRLFEVDNPAAPASR